MLRTIQSVLSDESGQGLTEYALILALVAVAAVAILGTLGKNINSTLSTAASDI
jgi:pilus assembly protein Flp/PilA